MADEIALNRYAAGIADYIDKMNQDNEDLEAFINRLLSVLTGQSITGLDVPRGLQQIFGKGGAVMEREWGKILVVVAVIYVAILAGALIAAYWLVKTGHYLWALPPGLLSACMISYVWRAWKGL